MGIKFRCHGCDKKLHVKAFLAGKRGVCPRCGAKVQIPLADEETDREAVPRSGSSNKAVAKPRDGQQRRATTPATAASAESATASSASSSATTAASARAARSSKSAKSSAKSSQVQQQDAIAEAPDAVWYVRPPSGGQYGPADAAIMRRWLNEGRVSADSLVWREGWEDWRTGDRVFPSLQTNVPVAEQIIAESVEPESLAAGLSLGSERSGTRGKPRASTKSHARNFAIVIGLSMICIGLLVALFLVLRG